MIVCDIALWQVTFHFKHSISKILFDASSHNSASKAICKIQKRPNNGMMKGFWHMPHFEHLTFQFGVHQCYHYTTAVPCDNSVY